MRERESDCQDVKQALDVPSQKDVSYTAVEMCFGNAATLCEDKNYKSCIQSCTLITD